MNEKHVVGVRFRHAGKVYYFDPGETSPKTGDTVIVETIRGVEAAEVVVGSRMVPEATVTQPLRTVIRQASAEDLEQLGENRLKEKEAIRVCQEKVTQHNLDMHLVGADYTFDRGKLIFYFTSEGRVDFRQLVRDLSGTFKTRIELRQIGVRDEAKMLGGLGSCGRQLCCCTFLSEFQPVSIRMAKKQDLSLNPTKISGLCGRLMCCLRYEFDSYPDTSKATEVAKELEAAAKEAEAGKAPGAGGLPPVAETQVAEAAAPEVEAAQGTPGKNQRPPSGEARDGRGEPRGGGRRGNRRSGGRRGRRRGEAGNGQGRPLAEGKPAAGRPGGAQTGTAEPSPAGEDRPSEVTGPMPAEEDR